MNIIYKITLEKRKSKCLYPYYYIGSKSNCDFVDGRIIDKNKKLYYGSSKHKEYKLALLNEECITIEILYESDINDHSTLMKMELKHQIENDVVKSKEYFNLSYAVISSYSAPDYVTVMHKTHGKVCRIHKNDIDDDWIGVSSGRKWYNNGITNKTFFECDAPNGWVLGRLGNFKYCKNNLNKLPKEEMIARGVQARLKNGNYGAWNKGVRGMLAKQSTKDKQSLAQKNRVKAKGYKNPMAGRIWINDGIINKTIPNTLDIPDGYKIGQIKKLK